MLIPVVESVMNLICSHGSEFYFACHSFFMSYYACACCFHLIKFRADEELVDQKKYLEDSCRPKCVKPLLEYEACVKRVEGDDSGHKHCTGQYFDYWFCIDKCVAPKLFSKLK
nr:cytochrome b-c1 complex subunit 6-like isoform X1 [Populus alba]